ncbi:hypothetical protein FRC16_001191 [Serendipita sp. 398]|nr:hypothetical protein FRC16_001191 [Serendipita sp. 398]
MDQFKALNPTQEWSGSLNRRKQPSNLRAAMRTGKTLLGVGLSFPSLEVARKLALTGYDWCFIDAEHAPFTPVLLAGLVSTISHYSSSKMIPVVRVPSHEPSFISTAIDAGAAGIILPHTETREQAQHLINECRFAPEGKRSYPPWSWIAGINNETPEGQTIQTAANDSIACIAQIESVKGVENAEDIIGLEGIDAIMIGIGDLRLDMNLPIKFDGDEPEYVAALDKLEGLARKYNKPLVGFAFPEMTDFFEDRVRRNYQLLMVAADSYTMTYGLAMAGGSSRARVAEIQATMAKEKEEAAQQANGHNGRQSNGISSKVEKGESEPEVVAVKA